MNFKIMNFYFLLILVFFVGCSSQLNSYQNSELGFEISYPENWEIKEKDKDKTTYSEVKFISTEKYNNSSADITVSFQTNSNFSDFDAKEFYETYPILDKKDEFFINENPAKIKSGLSRNFDVYQIVILKEDKDLYMITIRYPKENKDNLEEKKNLVLNSFKFIK